MKILFAGGGTAGHINPALAVAQFIKEKHPDAKISYIGTATKLEAKLVPQKGYDFYTIDVSGFSRSLTPSGIIKNISAVKKAISASIDCKKLLREIAPDVVVGTGGYVSGPVLKCAQKLGIKTAIHEQNAYPGVTTKMLAAGADVVMLAMPEAQKYLKLKKKPVITGNPIRGELLRVTREEARAKLGFDDRPMILSFGGSLGARYINEAVCELIKWHNGSDKYYHIHATGKVGYEPMKEALKGITLANGVRVREYIDDMDICMAAADLVICRAGAITLSELQACGKPSILIPSPYVAENHQFHNAMTLKRSGAAEIIEEKDLSGAALIKAVEMLIENKPKLNTMSAAARKNAITDANQRIYEEIMKLYTNA
ncbi:MAG: undecaprenyldiphospho-muramoylpentapeptide beta-N-acetylglucosaminyltransferase [Acutalibacteraceae bacterium]|jgi:UDP-N-acetylglucosamine--N-acetylmuramyl-(pentapeptide) pyrophosphoryl-undecaprenol N-acetylglucosamine transferase